MISVVLKCVLKTSVGEIQAMQRTSTMARMFQNAWKKNFHQGGRARNLGNVHRKRPGQTHLFHRSIRVWTNMRGQRPYCAAPTVMESTSAAKTIAEPNRRQLMLHAMRCAIPMIGFGIIDNLVMITAGERIEASIGVTLGLTTLAAAGLGQIVSDISGICSGGTVDALVGRLLPNLPKSGLTIYQKELSSARIAQTLGGCVGVTIGCLIGMSCLLFMDHEATERAKTARELEKIFDLVELSAMNTVDRVVGAEMSILWMIDKENDNAVWTRVVADADVATDQDLKKNDYVAVVKKLSSSRDLVKKTISTAVLQKRCMNQGPVRSMMTAPILSKDKEVLGVIQMINKKASDDGTVVEFTKHDADVVGVLCAHVSSFLDIVQTYQQS